MIPDSERYMYHDFEVEVCECKANPDVKMINHGGRYLCTVERENGDEPTSGKVSEEFFYGFKNGKLTFCYSTDREKNLLAIYDGKEMVCEF